MTDVYWLEQTEANVPAGDDWLGEHEAIRLDGLHVPKRRADWRLGRWTAKRAVAACLKLPVHHTALQRLEILAAESGAPEVFVEDQRPDVRISLTHRAGSAVCSVAMPGAALGCDLEVIESRSYAFTADYFTTDEQMLVSRSSPVDRPRLIALIWSAKESALKALQTGLRLDTRCVAVRPGDVALSWSREGWHPLEVRCSGRQQFHGWWRNSGDFLLTVVASPPPGAPVQLTLES